MVASLLIVPLCLHALGTAQYGLLLLITGLVALFPFLDLGLGLGVVTAVGQSRSDGDSEALRVVVSSAWFMQIAMSVAVLAAFALASVFVDWRQPLGVHGVSRASVTMGMAVLAVLVALSLPGDLGTRLLTGLGHTHRANMWQAAAAPLSLGLAAWGSVGRWPVPAFVAVILGSTVLPNVVLTIWTFAVTRPDLRPSWACLDLTRVSALVRLGALYAALGVAGALAFQTDALVLSHLVGVTSVATYNLTAKLYTIPFMVVSAAGVPLWPAFAEALRAGHFRWATRTLKRSVLAAIGLATVSAVLLVLFGRVVTSLWTSGAVKPPTALLLWFGLWIVMQCGMFPVSMIFNGAAIFRFQLVSAGTMALVNVALSIALTRRMGIIGPIAGTCIAYATCTVVPACLYLRRFLLKGDPDKAEEEHVDRQFQTGVIGRLM